jgi:hypothetical protein
MIRKGLRPGFKIGMDLPGQDDDFRRVLPFRRSWLAIGILAAMDTAFIIPAVLTFQQAATQWGKLDGLFDLVIAVFLSAWLLGWSIAPLLMTTILIVLLFGREVIKAHPGRVDLFIGLPFLGFTAQYDVARMRNLRSEQPKNESGKKSPKAWRGSHLAFDYGANTVGFGSDISSGEAGELRSQIEMAAGRTIRSGAALPEEIEGKWEPKKELAEETRSRAPSAIPPVESQPLTLASPSTLALIIANLVPVAGTLFLGWNLSHVMVIYWAESAVIGFFNLCKIVIIGRWGALLAGPFFLGHFGGFMAVHFLFIYTIFVKGLDGMNNGGNDLGEVALLFIALWPALAILFASHAFSFFNNFRGRQEYRGKTIKDQMSEPYNRIIFMHLVLILGGGLTLILGGAVPVLVLVIGLKIFFDVKAHLKEHRVRANSTTPK